MTFKPMLAAKLEDVGELKFPLLASPKLDGVRALIINGVVMSRSLKPIPNKHVQKLFGRPEFEGFDGELCVGPATAKDLMQKTMSGVMRVDGEPDVTYVVFDTTKLNLPYWERLKHIQGMDDYEHASCVATEWVYTQEGLDFYESCQLKSGFEGVMLRTPEGGYKQGRCGKKQPWLVKVKRFEDAEAEVIGVEELMHNDNEAEEDELGHTKRSTHQENLRPAGVLGALVCRTKEGVVFNIGTGFTAEQRQLFWEQHTLVGRIASQMFWERHTIVGRIAKYKHFANAGVKDAPRFPVFLGFRDERDL